MRYHYKATQRKATFLTIFCLVLFLMYSVRLYMEYQSDIVTLSYFVESGQDVTLSNSSMSATWITVLLCSFLSIIPAVVLLRSLHFPLRLKALAFLPSYIILGLITGISPYTVASVKIDMPILSSILLLSVSAVLIFLSQIQREDRGEHAPIANYLGANIGISCLGIIFCMLLTNSDRQLHVQLAMAKSMHRNDFSFMEKIHSGETTSNVNISSMQVLALSKKGQLADRLFSIPHLTGSECLLPDTMPASLVYHTPTLVYGHLQAIPVGKHPDATSFLEQAARRRQAIMASGEQSHSDSLRARPLMDYYLCALLLDRNLTRFVSELPEHYVMDDKLPRHYREALAVYYNMQDTLALRTNEDTAMDSLFLKYRKLSLEHEADPKLQRKACTRAYPHSYWNYYFYRHLDN